MPVSPHSVPSRPSVYSHSVAFSAHKNGYFEAELTPLEVKVKKGKEMFAFDEHPRETSIEKLGKLPPVFKENGTVSAGNASVSFCY